jgi:hypothetical protein
MVTQMSAECSLVECLAYFDDVLETLRSGFAAIKEVCAKAVVESALR